MFWLEVSYKKINQLFEITLRLKPNSCYIFGWEECVGGMGGGRGRKCLADYFLYFVLLYIH